MKVGVVGIGKMGRPMAERLIAAGHDVAICNRSENAGDASPARQGRNGPRDRPPSWRPRLEFVLTALPTEDAVRQVYAEMADVATAVRCTPTTRR